MLDKVTLSKAVRPVLKLSRITGILPITKHLKLTCCLLLYSLTLVLVIGYATFGSFLWLKYIDSLIYDSLMHLSLEKVQKGFLFLNYIAVVIAGIYYQKDYMNALNELKKVDKVLEDIQIAVSCNIRSIALMASVKYISLSILVFIDYFLSNDTILLFTVVDLISSHCPLIPIFSYELQMYTILVILAQRMNFITEQLSQAIIAVPHGDGLPKVYKLIKIYDNLRTLSKEVNRLNSFVILVTTASIFCLGIVNFHLLGTAGTYKRRELMSFLLCSFFLRLYELWNIIQPFVIISKEVDRFNAVLFRGMIQDRTGELYDNDKLYLHISKKTGIEFTAFGFFPLDFTLIQSVVGAASTLLVILIQYSFSKTVLWCD